MRLGVLSRSLGVLIVGLALAAEARAAVMEASESGTDEPRSTLAEIVVTAQKRQENLLDTPMSVSALTGADLERDHATRFEDYVGQVPGLNLIQGGPVNNQLVIRGVTTGSNPINNTVAIYVDETPWTSEGPFANPGIAPNLDTYDMQRIEVLRGPQGTLYGAIALGGLMKYVTNAPDPTRFATGAQVGGSYTSGGSAGYDAHGMINMPLAANMALRLVAYDSYYPGYIDDPSRGVTNINGSHVAGGRAALLFTPTSDLSIRLMAVYQDIRANDQNDVDLDPNTLRPLYGKWTAERLFSQPSEARNELYNATINWDGGFATLLSSTSYSRAPFSALQDYSAAFGSAFPPYGVSLVIREPVTNLTQELRLSSPSNSGPLQWQLGAYYNHEFANEYEALFLVDPTSRQVLYNNPENLLAYYIEPSFREVAGFANVDYFITPTLDIAAGGRYSSNHQSYSQVSSGDLAGVTDFITPSSDHSTTWSMDVRWHATPRAMLYGRVATGYAPGGPNDLLPGSDLPSQYKSSTTRNYELGIKTRALNDTVSAEVSVFEIDWSDIQVNAFVGSLVGIANGGRARSDGVEWNFGYVPTRGLTLSLNGAYTNARLEDALPLPTVAAPGRALPDIPKWSSSFGADYEHGLVAGYQWFAGINWRYVDARNQEFPNGPVSQPLMPAYHMVNLKAGVEGDRWTANLYVKNVGNTMAFSTVTPVSGGSNPGAVTATVLPPRTVGVTLSVKY
jgi:outer membrane receptor protein involved in Fe transport